MKKILVSSAILCAVAGLGFYVVSNTKDNSLAPVSSNLADLSSPGEPRAHLLDSEENVNAPSEAGSSSGNLGVSSTSSDFPEESQRVEKPSRLSLWEIHNDVILVDGIKGNTLSTKENLASYLEVNQLLEFPIPNKTHTLVASLESTHNHTANVAVWKAKVLGGHEHDNISIVKGRLETHITVATEEATYIAIINNATGKGTIVDQSDVIDGQIPFDDAIPVEPIEVPPPALSYSE